ncbi:MAG: hypothetical protein QME77_12240 [bacterium]|nr:hypothetical protein [bacterium]
MMATTTEVTAARYTDALAAALRLFDGGRGTVALSGRSLHGIGEQDAHIAPPFDVPLAVLQLLVDGYSLRLGLATRSRQVLAEFPCAWTLWRPATRFDKITGYRHAVEPAAPEAIAAALATMPVPSVLVDAGPEVWAGWRLLEPLDLRRSADQARAAQVALATRLGGDIAAAEGLGGLAPFAGRVRYWNNTIPDFITIAEVELTRRYTLDELTKEAS